MKSILLFLFLLTISGCQDLHSPLLITPSYGILNSTDIAAYENSTFKVRPFNPTQHSGIYWQCFKKPQIIVQCSPLGYIEEWASEGCNLTMTVETNDHKKHIYGMRRGMPVDYYHEKKTLWHNLTYKQKYVCFGGEYISPEVINGQIVTSHWIFDKIKTKKGKDSYWVEEDSPRLARDVTRT